MLATLLTMFLALAVLAVIYVLFKRLPLPAPVPLVIDILFAVLAIMVLLSPFVGGLPTLRL